MCHKAHIERFLVFFVGLITKFYDVSFPSCNYRHTVTDWCQKRSANISNSSHFLMSNTEPQECHTSKYYTCISKKLHLVEKYDGYLSTDIICFKKQLFVRVWNSRRTARCRNYLMDYRPMRSEDYSPIDNHSPFVGYHFKEVYSTEVKSVTTLIFSFFKMLYL